MQLHRLETELHPSRALRLQTVAGKPAVHLSRATSQAAGQAALSHNAELSQKFFQESHPTAARSYLELAGNDRIGHE